MATIYTTEPWGKKDQPWFLNTVVTGSCSLSPPEVLREIFMIEEQGGRDRKREVRWGPRTIDIDILLFGEECITTNELRIPHPQMKNRKFVLIPLLELVPKALDPETGIPYAEHLQQLKKQGVYYFSLSKYTESFRRNLENRNMQQ
jgi:2-amino-4-hydroxy-6-hydroxymethyldihydropteridine diphosphokinase